MRLLTWLTIGLYNEKMADPLREYIKESGTTQAELARQIGVKQPSLWKWMKAKVPATRVLQISEITGIPPEELRPDVFTRDLRA